jgi:hypothetical protein
MVVFVAVATAACSSSSETTTPTTPAQPTTTTVARPAGPAAALEGPLTAGEGVFIGSAYADDDLDPRYVEQEFIAAGTASTYRATKELTGDGRWSFVPDAEARYRTRVLVRRPKSPDHFSGVVLVEWLNVSGGIDADPDFVTLREEIVRMGHTWVGVSAQLVGVEGGPVTVRVQTPEAEGVVGEGLKAIDPARYGSLRHPGDGFSFDIFTQVARAVRAGGAALGGLVPAHVVAVGESQSAFALVTYINGVQPLTQAFDGFFVHSRGAGGLPLLDPGKFADVASAIFAKPAILRTDTSVPIFELQTESDVAGVINSLAARQPDTGQFRLWEVAGTAHADKRLVGRAGADIDCGVPINDGPLHVVAKAALRHLVSWIESGVAPPEAERLQVAEGAAPRLLRDADGIARGGVRTPPVDVPVRVLSSEQGPSESVICLLLGSTRPMPADRLAPRYPSRADYERRYRGAVDRAIAAGFVLEDDRAALDEYLHAELVAG